MLPLYFQLLIPMNPAEVDRFDCLPDELLLVIFNKLIDAKSLTQCIPVSKRFASLVCRAETVSLTIPAREHSSKPDLTLRKTLIKILVGKFISKPLNFFHHFIAKKSAVARKTVSFYSPNTVLTNFKELKTIHIELPSDGSKIGSLDGNDSLLKWKARFGTKLKNFVILSATSFQKRIQVSSSGHDKSCKNAGQVLTDDQMRSLIVCTISCLIAASARHYLLKQILKEHHSLENITASDVSKQGVLCMEKDEVAEARGSMKSMTISDESASMERRTRVPDLRIKFWYVPLLELPETGYVMKGAALAVITPNDQNKIGMVRSGDADLFGFDGDEECEEKAFNEAVKHLVKMKKSYFMTMNSF